MKRVTFKLFPVLLGLVACHFSHAQNGGTPQIQRFIFDDGATIQKVSDNGKWAAAYGPSAADETKDLYPKLINTTTGEVKNLCEDNTVLECAAYDITDDGMAVGIYNSRPAVWTQARGWQNLPLPEGWSTGRVYAVTADGRYAVGRGELGYTETPVMWDLENDGEIIATPNYPQKDKSGSDNDQVRFYDISSDGRYILGVNSYSYVGDQIYFVYDREKADYIPLGFHYDATTEKYTARENGIYFIDNAAISPNGKYVAGYAYIVKPIEGEEFPDEYRVPYTYNMETDEFTLFDDETSKEIGVCSTDDSNTLFAATPINNPVRSFNVKVGNYWIPLDQILKQAYGIDYYSFTEFEYTGTPASVSADGLTIGVLAAPSKDSYILTMPEPLTAVAARINLLADHTVTPAVNSTFSKLSSIKLTFTHNIKVLENDPTEVVLKDASGNIINDAIQFEADAGNSQVVNIRFRSTTLTEGMKYTVVIPEGSICIAGDETRKCDEIKIEYTGRAVKPVTMTEVSPVENNTISQINFTTNPVIATFDTDIALSATASAVLFRNDEEEPYCTLSMLASGNRLAIYPVTTQYLFKDNSYRIEIAAGSITDIVGNDGNELIQIHYEGAYVREVTSTEAVLLDENFDSGLNGMMLYDGDRLTPNEEMANWSFTNTANTPWIIARDEDDTNMAAASHSSYTPAGKSDDWMVTPQVYIPDGKCELTFKVQSYRKDKEDKLKVIVWVSEKVLNELKAEDVEKMRTEGDVIYEEIESPGRNEDYLIGDWTQRNISLEQYAGKSIYVAFVNENEDQSAIFVDDLQILHNQDFLIALTSNLTTIRQESEVIKGRVTINSGTKTFSDITLRLVDGEGNMLETIHDEGLSLKKDDSYPFEFTTPLPLAIGKANNFVVRVQMNESVDSIATSIKNLSFEPVKRVTVEEYTGMACPNCPVGIVAMEYLEEVYGDLLIPIAYHTYTGDIYESGLTAYTTYLGLIAAPSGVVNRLSTGYPLGVVNGSYSYYSPDGDSWFDVAEKELTQYADADINITASYRTSTNEITVPCTYKYALDADKLNVNLLAIVTEDNLSGYQDNNFSSVEDEIIKDWGKDGIYGKSKVVPYIFNDVARACIGTSYLGTGGYVPAEVVAEKEYNANITFTLPETVKDVNNCNVVCMMLDANTGKYINAARAKLEVINDGTDIKETGSSHIAVNGIEGGISVNTPTNASVTVYGINGSTLATAACNGQLRIGLNGYKGIALVRVTSGETSVIKKVIVK